MKLQTLISLFASCILFPFFSVAQQTVSAVSATYQYASTDQAMLDTLDAGLLQLEERIITATITLTSSESIDKLAVLIGSSEGSNDVFYKEFDYGVSGTFGDGTSYSASGNTITVGLGRFPGAPQYHVGAYALKADGSMEPGTYYVME